MNSRTVSLFIPEDKKYVKGTNFGSEYLKSLFDYYESVGQQQISSKDKKYRKLYNIANGVINLEDYIHAEEEYNLDLNIHKEDSISNIELMFYPLVPNIKNAIIGEYEKKLIKYSSRAINPENTNIILEKLTQELVSILVEQAEALFLEDNPNIEEAQLEQYRQSEEVQKYYSEEYRTNVEKWASHMMAVEDKRYDMRNIETKLLEQIITTEDPVVHVAYSDGHYFPEVLREKDCFYLKSPRCDDYSESMMFGWYNFCNIATVMNRWGDEMSEEQVLRLESWSSNYRSGFVMNGWYDSLTGNRTQDFESTQNYLTFKRLEQSSGSRYDELQTKDLIKETHIYFLLPRRKAFVTYKSANFEIKQLVDDLFVPTIKAVYEKGKPKTVDYLVEGEHVEWFYDNELFYGVRLDFNTYHAEYSSNSNDANSIWLRLGKHPVQYSDNNLRYGTRIPVHGGRLSNVYNQSVSLIERCVPWQIMYNWLWNRNQQLLSNEIGKFIILNELAIPSESLENSWGHNNVQKWIVSGRDNQIATIDPSISNTGQAISPQVGQVAQVVDMTKTQEILEKASLARMIKSECYMQIGLTDEYMYGKIEPRMSAQMVAMGNQRSSNQIQWIYSRLERVLVKLRTTMLETAQFIESQNPFSTLSYTTDEGQRNIFRISSEELTLGKLDIFVESSTMDYDVLERLKTLIITNNTLGMDAFELAATQTSSTVPDMLNRLKEAVYRKEQKDKEQMQHQQQMQEQQLQAAQQQAEASMQFEKEKAEREHEKDIMVAQIRSMGYANDDAEGIQKMILDLQSANQTQKEFYNKIKQENILNEMRKTETDNNRAMKDADRNLREKIEMKRLAQRDKELDIREKEVIASNRRTTAIKK